MPPGKPRSVDHLKSIFEAAVHGVHPKTLLPPFVKERLPIFKEADRIYAVSVGKSAFALYETLELVLQGEGLGIEESVVVSKLEQPPIDLEKKSFFYRSGHPIPNQTSLDAGSEVLSTVKKVGERDLLVCLISGGASALVEVLPAGITLEELGSKNRDWIDSGRTIFEINRERAQYSEIKSGGLARASQGRGISFILSDCYSKELEKQISTVGSGLTDHSDWENHIIGDLKSALLAAELRAWSLGYETETFPPLEGEMEGGKDEVLSAIESFSEKKNVCLLFGGELTLRISGKSGAGGRNQHLAAVLLESLRGRGISYQILCAGTDGNDGNTAVAGAWISNENENQNAKPHLEAFNTHAFFKDLNQTWDTGSTGTNVADLVIVLINADH